jgi:hypothetical protein
MAAGFPAKANYATGDILTATNMNDLAGTLNLVTSSTLSISAGKNAVINGAFDVWQRGTSVSIAAAAGTTYSADRWCGYTGTGQAITVSRQATGDTTNLPNIQYAMRFQRNSGQTGTGTLDIAQSMETINSIPYAGKTVTLSFYARAGANFSSAANALTSLVVTGTGTDQNQRSGYTGQAIAINSTSTLTTTWQRFTATATLPTTMTEMSVNFEYTPVGTAGTNDYFEVTGVQLELGSTATSFARNGATYQGELAACQRYYWRTTISSGNYTPLAVGISTSTTEAKTTLFFPVQMRAVSSIDTSSLYVSDLTAYTIATSAVVVDTNTSTCASLKATTAIGQTVSRTAFLTCGSANNGYIGFNGEL